MTEETYFTYDVKCKTCYTTFQVHLFDSHEKNLFVVDKKDWYCDKCKKEYIKKQASDLSQASQDKGFSELKGSLKQISWAEKVRSELINKVDYLQKSLSFEDESEKELSDKAFQIFLLEWKEIAEAKWWIDNRRMTVRDISKRIEEIRTSM